MAFQASKYFEAIVIGAQFLWGWQLIQNCFFSLLIFSLSIFGHTSLHLHISEVCGLRNYKERAIIIPALVWAQELHTDLLPCGFCFSPQFKRFGMPCWCQQLLCLLAPFCLLFPRHPCGWTHGAGSRAIKMLSWLLLEGVSSGEERHFYQQANENVTLEKPSDGENNN